MHRGRIELGFASNHTNDRSVPKLLEFTLYQALFFSHDTIYRHLEDVVRDSDLALEETEKECRASLRRFAMVWRAWEGLKGIIRNVLWPRILGLML